MFALDAATGSILWQLGVESSVNSGPSVVNSTVYWGTGYSKLFAFGINGRWAIGGGRRVGAPGQRACEFDRRVDVSDGRLSRAMSKTRDPREV